MGGVEFVPRPQQPSKRIWGKSGLAGTGEQYGLLANGGRYNRNVDPRRVMRYAETIVADQWRDNLIDPVAITPDGEVINGQHRLAAFSAVTLGEDEPGTDADFRFLVVFDVPAAQVALGDASKRTPGDLLTHLDERHGRGMTVPWLTKKELAAHLGASVRSGRESHGRGHAARCDFRSAEVSGRRG